MLKDIKIEKINYFLFFVFLTLIPIAIFQSLLETWYIKQIMSQGLVPQAYDFLGVNSYLSPLVKLLLLIIGIIGGYFLGRREWELAVKENTGVGKEKK